MNKYTKYEQKTIFSYNQEGKPTGVRRFFIDCNPMQKIEHGRIQHTERKVI